MWVETCGVRYLHIDKEPDREPAPGERKFHYQRLHRPTGTVHPGVVVVVGSWREICRLLWAWQTDEWWYRPAGEMPV